MMLRGLVRGLWWVAAFDRPRWAGDVLAVLIFPLLLLLGAAALSWPWLSVEVARTLGVGLAATKAVLSGLAAFLASLLP